MVRRIPRTSRTQRAQGEISRALIYTALGGYLLWVLFPMVWLAYSSLKPDAAIFAQAFALPEIGGIAWGNYARAWREARFSEYFINSLGVTLALASVAGIVALGAMAAYALSRFFHPLGNVVFWLFLAGLMIVTVPIQLVYPALQKQLVKGITAGALKG